jgi:hypothetical protein
MEGGMGYDVHITRAKHWLDSKKRPIALRDWLAYVEQDPQMELEEVAIGRVKGEPVIAYQSKGLAVWVAYSGHDPEGNKAWFDWRDGRIEVKNPDQEILAKMKQIAAHFGANVIGDDGEQY